LAVRALPQAGAQTAPEDAVMAPFEVTRILKEGGTLTKHISLNGDGELVSDGSACVMSHGHALRAPLSSAQGLADLIGELGSSEAIALGTLRKGLPDYVKVVTKHKLNGASRPDLIARTQEYIAYWPGEAAFALIDFDQKAMPASVAERLRELGGLRAAIQSVLPGFASVAQVIRRSTSAGIYNADTGEPLSGSGGIHIFILVRDGGDIERFLKALHERCWLAGLGWMMIGAGGQLLDRSVIDRSVGAGERLVFEGPPIVDPPLAQDEKRRRPVATEGEALDTVAAGPPLTILEEAKFRELRAREANRLGPEADKNKSVFIDRQARELAKRTGIALFRARRTIERQCEGVLLPDVVLPFDDPGFAGKTVADVLADPTRFEGATLADPLEGVAYGTCKARIMRRADGSLWIKEPLQKVPTLAV
jgi:hypothetical protein